MLITAIIPAYNEGKYLKGVLAPLKKTGLLSQIIVVSDGSTDNTVAEALSEGVEVIALPENTGKGGAMAAGMKKAIGEVILFLDADLIGLNEEHIKRLIEPVVNNEADMTVGVFGNGRATTDMAQTVAPFLSGQRCIKRKWLSHINEWADAGFGIEAALTLFAHQKGLCVQYVSLPEMSHVMKEEKLGLLRGFAYRMKMYWEIAKKVRPGG